MSHGRVPPVPLTGARGERVVDVDAGPWPQAPLEVALVAAAVDEGRALAARAARDGAGRVVVRAGKLRDADVLERLADWLAGPRTDPAGPLSALRRLGDGQLAVLVGVVLGAGEQGMTAVCADRPSVIAGQLAVAIEPELDERVSALA